MTISNFNAILFLLLINTCPSFAQKIPVTSSSDKAIEWYQKGWMLEDQLKTDAAELAYQKALELDSTFALVHLRMAMLRDNYDFRRIQLKAAMKYIDKVTEGEKLWIQARNDFYGTGNGEIEYGCFKKLQELYPNDEKANYYFGYINAHHGVNDPELAILHLNKAIEINPDYITPYNQLAYSYMDFGDYKNAEKITKRYIDLLPNEIAPLDTYADLFMRQGAYQKSLDAYNRILAIDPEFPWAIIGAAANLNFMDKHKKGRKFLKRLNISTLSDYQYRHKWRASVVSFIDEGNIKGAIKTLQQQKKKSIKGKNKKEPFFHVYYSFLRIVRLYFENDQPDLGLKEYEKWNAYIKEHSTKESTKKRIENLKWYYLAYEAYIKNQLDLAEKHLLAFEKLNEEPTEDSKMLAAKILIKKEKFPDAIMLLKTTDLSDPYHQYWYALALKKNADPTEANIWKEKIIGKNEFNNIDLALVRKKAQAL